MGARRLHGVVHLGSLVGEAKVDVVVTFSAVLVNVPRHVDVSVGVAVDLAAVVAVAGVVVEIVVQFRLIRAVVHEADIFADSRFARNDDVIKFDAILFLAGISVSV